MALEYKRIEYEIRPVNILKPENQSPEYLKINPSGQVPAFVTENGEILTQSPAIFEYLEEVYPEKNILPKDPLTRAKVREVVGVISCGIQPIQNPIVAKKHSSVEAESQEWARYWINRGFEALEEFLMRYSGKYSVGDEITIADFCIVPQVYNAIRFKVDMTKFPTIARVNETLLQMDVFKAAHPSAQPDCPLELRG